MFVNFGMEESCVSYIIMIVLQSTLFSRKNKKLLIANVTDINVSIHGVYMESDNTSSPQALCDMLSTSPLVSCM